MLRFKTQASRAIRIATAGALAVSALAPAILTSNNADAAQVTARNVKISSSVISATAVDYEVSFKVGNTSPTTIKGFVVEFCDDTPLLTTACDTTAGRVPSITSVANPITGLSATSSLSGTWTGSGAASSTFKMVSVAGNSLDDNDANPVVFKFQATNPTTNAGTSGHAFYARIYTYINDSGASSPVSHTGGVTTGGPLDGGGVALSTADAISISAKVMETLTFCVSGTSVTDCSAPTTPTLALGHGGNTVLDNTAVDVANAWFVVSTNAAGKAVVRMKGNVLTSGGNTIPAVNAGANTPLAIAAGTAAFGMRIGTTAGTDYCNTGSCSLFSVDANYSHATNYGYDTTTANDNTSTTYGDTIATINASINTWVRMNFAATASVTTPAGLYTSTQNLIATGTY